ncbi:MAG: TolB-like 6-bladed beta-propeller domain-containing protein [Mariniphaga sp.]|nr:TolB-like 6-bladed beta-propeller domain-containing protein [Mariniphaga sp.]
MKKLYIVVTICLTSFLFSCTTNENSIKVFNEFPQEYKLKSTEVNTPSILYMVGEIELLDSVLIAMDLQFDKIFHVFKLPDINYLGSYIRRGRGPNEETFIDPYFRQIQGNSFIYYNSISIKIAKFDSDSSKIIIAENYNLPGKLMDLQCPFILNNQIIGWNPYGESNKEFLSYDLISKEINPFGAKNLEFEYRIRISIDKWLFAKIVSIKPDKSQFAVVYDKFPILRIYKENGELQNEIRYINEQIFPKALISKNASKSELNQITQNYRKIKTTDKYIYALYIGKTNKELNIDGYGLDDFSNEIHVWDWSGNPVAKVSLDKNYFSFCVTRDDKYLICSSLGSISSFYKYSLPWEK